MSLNEMASAIKEWREVKGFYTPDSISGNSIPLSEILWLINEYEKAGEYIPPAMVRAWILSLRADLMLGKLMLVVTEVAEAAEEVRHKNTGNFSEEIADIFIRLLDICATVGIDIEGHIQGKMKINKGRPRLHDKKSSL